MEILKEAKKEKNCTQLSGAIFGAIFAVEQGKDAENSQKVGYSSAECTKPLHSQSPSNLSQTSIRKELPQRRRNFRNFIDKIEGGQKCNPLLILFYSLLAEPP